MAGPEISSYARGMQRTRSSGNSNQCTLFDREQPGACHLVLSATASAPVRHVDFRLPFRPALVDVAPVPLFLIVG
jgi:hypothetical protein